MTHERAPVPILSLVDVDGISGTQTAYPAAVHHRDLLFISGQVSFTDDGSVAHHGDIRGQIRQSLERLDRVLAAAGSHRGAVLSATVYLTDAADAAILNEEWRAWFGSHRPARATAVAQLLDPRLLVEISAICAVTAPENAATQ